jgi:hypothetical protein
MRRLPLLISLGLLAACGQTGSAPASETADEATSTADGAAPASAADNAAADTGTANATGAPTPAAPETEKPASVASLPLKRGFYVVSDTPCGRASNATLSLLRRDGFTVSGRDFCEFVKIEKTGATGYRVTEECSSGGEAWGTEEQKDTSVVTWEIPGDTQFRRKSDSGWESSARYCAQSSLPEPWRDNDISDLVK